MRSMKPRLFPGSEQHHSGGWRRTGCGPDAAGFDGRLEDGTFVRQAGYRSHDLARRTFRSASDRAAGVSADGFGINGTAGASRALYSILAVFSRQPRLALLASRPRRPCRTRIALVALGALEASAEPDCGDAQDNQNWKTPPVTPGNSYDRRAPANRNSWNSIQTSNHLTESGVIGSMRAPSRLVGILTR